MRRNTHLFREWYGVMAAMGAASGFVVTSGRYPEAATTIVSGRNVTRPGDGWGWMS